MKKHHKQVQRRDDSFAERQITNIWHEIPSPDNPYIAADCSCHGYNLFELMKKRTFVDVFFLLFNTELPTEPQKELLETLMISLINPGPRHPATRAAMNAGVGKTDKTHILPISLGILAGTHLGAAEVELSMRFIKRNVRKDPGEVADLLLSHKNTTTQGDWHPAPGFGSRFSGIDELARKIACSLLALEGSGKYLKWGNEFASFLDQHKMGWLMPGIAAAAFIDLGFNSRSAAGLFQLLSAPGLFAQGLELTNKPITAMPFLNDEDYIIEK